MLIRLIMLAAATLTVGYMAACGPSPAGGGGGGGGGAAAPDLAASPAPSATNDWGGRPDSGWGAPDSGSGTPDSGAIVSPAPTASP